MTARISTLIVPAMLAGFLLDQVLGDPRWMYHPVRLIGKLIDLLQKPLRRWADGKDGQFSEKRRASRERTAGMLLALLVIAAAATAAALLVHLAGAVSDILCFLVMTLLDYWLFAVKSLKDESMRVYEELKKNDLPAARYAVSMIVGRDTDRLDEQGVAKAAVETVAENTSDGVIAPLLCMAVGGPVLGWLYKAVNTLDSMIGYKDDKFLHIGRFAAKLDDAVNFIPARITGILLIVCAPLAGLDAREAWRIFRRDRYNHASPNSAQTEAAAAGALHIQLAGDACYFGKLYHKKTIGDPIRPVEAEDIIRVNRLMYAASITAVIVLSLVRMGLSYVIA